MGKLALIVLLFVGCSSDDKLYTYGEAAQEMSAMYCQAVVDCGYLNQADVDICTSHSTWHLCEPGRVCDAPIDQSVARIALDKCYVGLHTPDFENRTSLDCYLLGYFGFAPEACFDAFDLKPQLDGGAQ